MLKYLSLIVAGTVAFCAAGQAKVQNQETFDYNRCSLTILPVAGSYNSTLANWASQTDFDGKFDVNVINARSVSGQDSEEILNSLNNMGVGKMIVDYWLQFDGSKFSTKVLEKRARYNVTDADVLNAQATKIGVEKLLTIGFPLIKNSYVMAVGPVKMEQSVDKKGNKTYRAAVDAHVYQLVLNDTILESIWSNWLGDDATPESINAYNEMSFRLKPVVSVKEVHGSAATPDEAVYEACNEVLEPLEKKIDKWQVVTTVYERSPLRAKIGRKEGVKNSDRFGAYKVIEDADGNTRYKRVGWVRATKVADNAKDADGSMASSKFYQISGVNVQPGMFLKQKKDCRFSIGLSYNHNGYSPAELDVDFLVHTTQTLGIMQYVGLSVGFDQGKNIDDKTANWLPVSINYAIGIHPVRWIEIRPNIGIGADYSFDPNDLVENENEDDDSSFSKRLAYYAHGGVKVDFQVWYPVHLFVRADYGYRFGEGDFYQECESHKRFKKISFGAGVRINF